MGKRNVKRREKEKEKERKRERKLSDKNKTLKNKTGRTTALMRATE